MRVVIQVVSEASVSIDGQIYSQIQQGLLIFLGIEHLDTEQDIAWLSKKIANLRIFADENNQMNKSVIDVKGQLLVVSQFTLHAKTKKGNRPSFIEAARPEVAIPLYEAFVKCLSEDSQSQVLTGQFGANMQVNLCNDGPVTILIDSKN
ncbi:MAG: D-tyrosyl-tRNA(Tyr) deacylase [Flavobacteriales bacterium]|nr:D-tyrosyl-tRNA(Tyr) deacylase [Flavobacteriales bacterium]